MKPHKKLFKKLLVFKLLSFYNTNTALFEYDKCAKWIMKNFTYNKKGKKSGLRKNKS